MYQIYAIRSYPTEYFANTEIYKTLARNAQAKRDLLPPGTGSRQAYTPNTSAWIFKEALLV